MKKLNGWQRLWVLISCLWLVAVVFFSFTMYSTKITKHNIYENFSRVTLLTLANYTCEAQNYNPNEYLRRFGINLSDSTLLKPSSKFAKLTATFCMEIPISLEPPLFIQVKENTPKEIVKKIKARAGLIKKNILFKRKSKYVLWTFLAWLLPCLTLYGLGLGISWVYKGFRSS